MLSRGCGRVHRGLAVKVSVMMSPPLALATYGRGRLGRVDSARAAPKGLAGSAHEHTAPAVDGLVEKLGPIHD